MKTWRITVTVTPLKGTWDDDRARWKTPVIGEDVQVEVARDFTPFEEIFTVIKPTEAGAIKEAVYLASVKESKTGPRRGPHRYNCTRSEEVTTHPGTSGKGSDSSLSDTDIRAITENVFTALSNSTEFAGVVAEAKNLEKMVDKLGGLGKVMTGVSVATDSVKFFDSLIKYSRANSKSEKEALYTDLFWTCVSLTRTAVTIAFPPLAVVDAAISTLELISGLVDDYTDKRLQDKAMEETRRVMQEKYDKEKKALKPGTPGYKYEVKLYAFGLSIEDVLERRKYYTTPNPRKDSNLAFFNPYKKYTEKQVLQKLSYIAKMRLKYGTSWYYFANKDMKVKITFDANGGDTPDPETKTVSFGPGATYGKLPYSCHRDKYWLKGWYSMAEGGNKIEPSTPLEEIDDHAIYAHWTDEKIASAYEQASKPKEPAPARLQGKYQIGNRGPGGGMVFLSGVECSNIDLGDGKVPADKAESLAKSCMSGGKTDWRLPTFEELMAMKGSLLKIGIGGFKTARYYYLSPSGSRNAAAIPFVVDIHKLVFTWLYFVRPVRSFDPYKD